MFCLIEITRMSRSQTVCQGYTVRGTSSWMLYNKWPGYSNELDYSCQYFIGCFLFQYWSNPTICALLSQRPIWLSDQPFIHICRCQCARHAQSNYSCVVILP